MVLGKIIYKCLYRIYNTKIILTTKNSLLVGSYTNICIGVIIPRGLGCVIRHYRYFYSLNYTSILKRRLHINENTVSTNYLVEVLYKHEMNSLRLNSLFSARLTSEAIHTHLSFVWDLLCQDYRLLIYSLVVILWIVTMTRFARRPRAGDAVEDGVLFDAIQ